MGIRVSDAIMTFYPKARFQMSTDDDYEHLTWLSTDIPKPSKEELLQKVEQLGAERPLKEFRLARNKCLEQTDRYTAVDYPHSNLAVQQARLDQRQALRDLPTLVTPLSGGCMKLWVTNENGSLQVGDSLVLSNTAGYFTKGEPAVATIICAYDFSDTHYSNIVSITESNMVTHEIRDVGDYKAVEVVCTLPSL